MHQLLLKASQSCSDIGSRVCQAGSRLQDPTLLLVALFCLGKAVDVWLHCHTVQMQWKAHSETMAEQRRLNDECITEQSKPRVVELLFANSNGNVHLPSYNVKGLIR